FLDCFAVINRLLALLQSYIRLFPGRLATYELAAASQLAHEIDRAYVVHLYLKDGLDCRLDLGLGRVSIDAEGQQLLRILCFFFGSQRLFSNYGRLDDVPNCSHAASLPFLSLPPSNCSSSVAASRESTSVS